MVSESIIIAVSAAGGGVVLFFCSLVSLIICCFVYSRRRRSGSASIMNSTQFPKFRVIDQPNPIISKIDSQNDTDGCGNGYLGDVLDDKGDGSVGGRSPAKLPSLEALNDKSSEYSYALPSEIRIIPPTPAGRGKDGQLHLAESTFVSSTETTPIRQLSSNSMSPKPDSYGSCADYSTPITVIEDSNNSSSVPPYTLPIDIVSPSRSDVGTKGDDPLYMTPATNEETLYMQIKSMRVPFIDRDSIEVLGELGSGNFGCVLKCIYNESSSTKLEAAAKTLKDKHATIDKIKFLQEAAIMGQFHHNNIVKLYGVVVEGTPLMIVLEILPLGDLRNYLIKINPSTPDRLGDRLLGFCRDVAHGMQYLAKKSFIHRDLAARNILLSKNMICKIGDFGLARDLMDEQYYIAHGGVIPVRWTAPEAINFRKYSTASDVWSFGCLMYEIFSLGHKPYGRKNNKEVLQYVEEGSRLAPPPGCTRSLYQIMIECWHPNASERPRFENIVSNLSESNEYLLSWGESDRSSCSPEGIVFGSSLSHSESLYIDLQMTYVSV